MLISSLIRNILISKTRYNNHAATIIECTRFKTKGSNRLTDNSDSEQSEDANVTDKSSTTMRINVTNTRVDLIIKSGLGIARNKIEKLFYENKIRVNGQKIGRKSEQVEEGDEIDVIKGPSPNNPEFSVVARVEILSMKPNDDTIAVKIRRCRSLLVDKNSY